MSALSKDLQEFLSLLNAHRVDYMVVGGYAMAVHGVPRYTKDLDIWVERSPDNAARILAAMGEFGFADGGITAAQSTCVH